MAIESPEGSDPRLEDFTLGTALRRRLPRILLVTVVLLAATYLVLPFIPAGSEETPVGVVAESTPLPIASGDVAAGADSQLAQLQQRVTDSDTKAANFEIANDLYKGGDGSSFVDQQVTAASTAIAAAEARRDAAQSNATLIRGLLDAKQPLDTVRDIRDSIAIQQLEQQKGQITAQRAQLLATFLPNHPGVVTATAQIAAIDKQIVIEARRVADALDAQAKIETTGLDALQQNLDGLKAKQGGETRNVVALDALKRDAAANRAQLQGYLARYGVSPGEASATAAPSVAPPSEAAARNPLTILAAVGVLALAIQIGAVFLLGLLSNRATRQFAVDDSLENEPYQHVDEVASERFGAAEPEVAGAALQAYPPPSTKGLRRWFIRHSKTADPIAPDDPAVPNEQAVVDTDLVETIEPQVQPDVATSPSDLSEWQEEVMTANGRGLANLSADLILGRASIVVLASLGEPQDSEILAERLASDALEHGLSVAHVDAGSQHISTEPGITDLAADRVGFGDVVFKVAEGLAEIPWGHLASLDPDSDKPATLVEALSEVYEVVLVAAGTIGADDGLGLFAGLNTRLVLVGSASPAHLDACRAEAQRLGFRQIEVLATPNWHAEVA